MITFEKLLKRTKSENIAVHTVMEEQAKALLKALDERGYVWASGVKLTTKEVYENYEERTCYNFGLDKQVWYDSLSYCRKEGYTIIEFSEINFEENKI